MTIPFHSKCGAYAWLSNFHPVKVTLDGVEYRSVENAYQAAKTLDPEERLPFRVYAPWAAKRCGGNVTLRPEWNDKFKLALMLDLITQKYQRPDLRLYLMLTLDAKLQEATNDPFWGRGRDGLGWDHLGRLTMQVRKSL